MGSASPNSGSDIPIALHVLHKTYGSRRLWQRRAPYLLSNDCEPTAAIQILCCCEARWISNWLWRRGSLHVSSVGNAAAFSWNVETSQSPRTEKHLSHPELTSARNFLWNQRLRSNFKNRPWKGASTNNCEYIFLTLSQRMIETRWTSCANFLGWYFGEYWHSFQVWQFPERNINCNTAKWKQFCDPPQDPRFKEQTSVSERKGGQKRWWKYSCIFELSLLDHKSKWDTDYL